MSDGARLEASGKLEEALKTFASQRDWDGAVRVAMALNRHLEAANYCLEAGRFWDAAVCFQRGGALQECIAALGRVPANNARYRQAVVHAVRVAGLINTPLDSLSTWLMPFIGHAPAAPVEAEAMKVIAESFAVAGKDRLASSIFRTVLTAFPNDDDARERFEELAKKAPQATPVHGAESSQSGSSGVFNSTPSGAVNPSTTSGIRSSVSGVTRALRRKLGSLLVEKGLITLSHLERLTREQPELTKNDAALAEAVVATGLVKDVDVLRTLSEQAGIPYIIDAELVSSVSPEAARVVNEDQARSWRVVPIKIVDRALHVAMEDPRDVALVDRLRFATRLKISPFYATSAGIRRATSKLYQGYDPEENVPEWHGQLFDPTSGSGPSFEPFSDRVTGTREHNFDTNEFALKDAQLARRLPTKPPNLGAVPPPPMPTVGSKLADRYQLEAIIGEGGSASVFRALDLELNEHVAVKVFHPASEREADTLVARFKLELSLSRALSHPNITRLFDLGSAGPWRYLTMELLDGVDLARKLEEARGPLPLREGLSWLEQACHGLQAAHERDVVHRDVKPQNLFVTTSGVVKLMDFGIARKRTAVGVTMSGMIGGTPEYMSPEQINNFSDVTYATDLYALGVTAYQLFTGVLPFDFPELTRLLIAQASEQPAPPRSHNPAMPELLERLILNLLEKDPLKRPASALWVGQQLRSLRLLSR